MLGPILVLACAVVSVLLGRKLAFSRRRSPARAAPNGPQASAAQARAAPSHGAHQKNSVADAHPDPTLDESSDDDATPLVEDDLVADDFEMPHDRSTDSSVITCVRIDSRAVLSEEPIRSRPRSAPKAPPQPEKLPSILEMMQRSSAGSSGATKKPAAANAKVNVPRPAGVASVQALPRARAPQATPQAQRTTSAPADASPAKAEQQPAKPAPHKPGNGAPLPRLPR